MEVRKQHLGSLAQLVERHVYTVDVIGSIPVGPTKENPVAAGLNARRGGVFCSPCAVSCTIPAPKSSRNYLCAHKSVGNARALRCWPRGPLLAAGVGSGGFRT